MNMKNVIKLEELFFVVFAIFLFADLDYSWWWFPVLLFAPDLSMIGYAAGPVVGAYIYNFVHHRAIAVSLYVIGALLGYQLLQLIGIIVLAHSSLDRVFGYGLKHTDAFESTHLGRVGPSAKDR
jgi:MFS family permease